MGMSLSKFVARFLCAGDIVFDVGANNGNVALLLASCVGKSGHVCAFEPNPDCFSKLEQIAKIAYYRNLRVYPFALSDISGTLTMMIDLREGSGASTVVAESAERESMWHKARYSKTLVTAITLDAFCETSGYVPTFLKIDVEGAEEMVIRGGQGIIARYQPIIWFECWCGLESGKQINLRLGHFKQLSDLGYSFFLATIFKFDGTWIYEGNQINPLQLLPFDPQMLECLPPMGSDILAVTNKHIDRLQNYGLISELDAKSHILKFTRSAR